VSNKDSHAATKRPGPILDSLESCRLGFRSSLAAVTFDESASCQHGEGDTPPGCSTHAGQGSTLQVQRPSRHQSLRCREPCARKCKWTRAVCVARVRWSTRPFTCSLHKRSSVRREDTSRRRSCNPDQASCGTRKWLSLIRCLPSLYLTRPPDLSILSPAEQTGSRSFENDRASPQPEG
jgi:hypothetical protein